ncbi:unnamed protein product [Cylicocyclus nassatus]|uniref:alpha-amylase n=1 Tax=Cylicocyclus nassatus TaxID=53992 RepID=A0AA36GIB8_CYLNA|nr:unnamed protein product [Cylicocyclus nassatus]
MGSLFYILPCLLVSVAADPYDDPHTLWNRQTMVHLFEWKWSDIARECENFLQHYGYGAVQVSPPNEHITLDGMPWWIRYQPISYNLVSRSGNEGEFQDMVNRCNAVGVRIVVDVVMNHMAGVGQKSGWGKGSSGGSSFDATDGVESFPAVPYGVNDFNDFRCHGDIGGSDYGSNAANVRNCRLVGLLDLNQGSPYVRGKLIEFAHKQTLQIFGANQRPFVVHEVIDRGGESIKCSEYCHIGRYTNFNYGSPISAAARGQANWKDMGYMGPGWGYGNHADNDVLVFIDNHDNQRDGYPATYKEGDTYRLAVAFMLAWTYGYPRVMSSFYFGHKDQGPPGGGPWFNGDGTCSRDSGWVCEHRWPTIREMARFRSTCAGAPAVEKVIENNHVAFARQGKGFFAVNGPGWDWTRTFQTTLPAGQYCDVYNGRVENGRCTGATINVGNNGMAQITIGTKAAVAISLASKVGSQPGPGPQPPQPTQKPKPEPTGLTKTVIFLKRDTMLGENLFIRGGNSHGNGGACASGPYQQSSDKCAIPIYHKTTVPNSYATYKSWSQGDYYLDFEGPEQGQGTYEGQTAFGTPLAYSTNDPQTQEYQPYNKYGKGYWMVEVNMDCSKTDNGWFELKGYLNTAGWEGDINQGSCTGGVGGTAPFKSINHIAKCGADVNATRCATQA